MSDKDRSGLEGRALKLTLVGVFVGASVAAGSQRSMQTRMSALDLVVTGMAAHRIGRMIAFERVAEPLREPFTATVPDDSGADQTVVARGRGFRWTVGELLSCPICVGTWAALSLSIGMRLLPGPTRFVVRVLGIAAIAELNHVAVERLEWSARESRRAAAPATG